MRRYQVILKKIAPKCAKPYLNIFGLFWGIMRLCLKHRINKPKEETMKKISIIAIMGAVASFGAYAVPSAMANNNTMTEVVTVEQVRGMSDNSPVIIQGYILRKNGENSYVFQDTTGTINLEIDEEDWGGLTVSPNDFVEIWGEVDRNGSSIMEVDVSAIKKL